MRIHFTHTFNENHNLHNSYTFIFLMVLVEVRNNLKQTLSHLNSKLLRCGGCKLQSIQLIWIIPNSIYFQAGSQQKAVYIKLINSENQYTAGMTLWHHKIDMRYSARQEWQDVTRGWAFFLWVLGWWQKDIWSYGWSLDQIGLTGLTSHSHIMDQGCKHYDAIWHIDFSSQANRLWT